MKQNWPIIPLSKICRPTQWKTISQDKLLSDGFPVYGANGTIGFYSEYNHEHPTILITCRGATCGTINICEPKSYVTGNAMALDDLDPKVDFKFVYHQLKSRGFTDVISGSAQPQITRSGLEKINVVLPPFPEQRRIAAILDKADAIRRKRQETIKMLDEFLRSVFLDMFGDPVRNEKGWEIKRLDEVTTKITDGVHQKPNYIESGIPFISVKNITNGYLDFNECKYISENDHLNFTKRCKPEYNDILYTKVGATYGRPALINSHREFSIYVSVALIKPDKDKVDPVFLREVLSNPAIKNQADQSIKGVGVPDLHLIEIKKFLVPCPPKDIQKTFVDLTQTIQKQRNKIIQANVIEDELFNALTQRAFRGDL